MIKQSFQLILLWFFTLFSLVSFATTASESATGPHIEVRLLAEDTAFVPGETQYLGILLSPESEWHTYWRNPGDSGEPPVINWTLPDYLSAGEIQWPIPHQIPVAHLVNYGYDGDNLLMVPFTVADNAPVGETADIVADLSWLVCKEDCIPGWTTLTKQIPVDATSSPTEQSASFVQTRQQLPQTELLDGRYEVTESHLSLSFSAPYASEWQLLPFDSAVTNHAASQQYLVEDAQSISVISRSDYFVDQGQTLQFLLTDGEQGYYLTARPVVASAGNALDGASLPLLLLMAFVGGLILNLMPCVLPVLSIKALSLSQSTEASSLANKLGYAIGILVSFNVFAMLIIILKQGGEAIGWGFHMQEPIVVGALAYLFVFIALILLDVAPAGSRFAGIGQTLIQGKGFSAQFFTGVLAVVVASPCTAPFMATALGVALVSEPFTTFALFSALAFGLATPLTAIYLVPAWQKWLPKPGEWMNRFRQFLAFPMLATVIWLVWVYLSQTDALSQLLLLCGLLVFALSCWWLSFSGRKSGAIALVLLVGSIAWPLMNQATPSASMKAGPNLAYSEDALRKLRNSNQVVLVNMTADWCITCKVNEQVAFRSDRFESVISQEDVHYMVGDWTNKNDEILGFLNRYQRSGVPLYVVYAGNREGQVLPQVLTTDLVIDAIKSAQQEKNHEG
ncbi:protein-disulfide reductase DsbD family protein [Ferrimonas marina]|uniref:Thiol:disulfide interchange protein DsbD n=1 Tax=Ferrimonas marina TaxID=299255 RepID=A0A1M5VW16_9GAMM|nr:protein-disulfide reductase DsbD domain-containing protein [Ferrimonas marina]SHH79499.1 thiol:disulfide interchange protein DsbD [Ferrimonas marina]